MGREAHDETRCELPPHVPTWRPAGVVVRELVERYMSGAAVAIAFACDECGCSGAVYPVGGRLLCDDCAPAY